MADNSNKLIQRVTGVQGLIRQLSDVPKRAKKALRTGFTKAGKIVINAAKPKVPVQHGYLRKSLITKVMVRGDAEKAYAVTGPETKLIMHQGKKVYPGRYGHLVESGTEPHEYVRERKDYDNGGTKLVRSRAGKHPGSKPQPFLTPAFATTQDQQLDALATELMKEIEGGT